MRTVLLLVVAGCFWASAGCVQTAALSDAFAALGITPNGTDPNAATTPGTTTTSGANTTDPDTTAETGEIEALVCTSLIQVDLNGDSLVLQASPRPADWQAGDRVALEDNGTSLRNRDRGTSTAVTSLGSLTEQTVLLNTNTIVSTVRLASGLYAVDPGNTQDIVLWDERSDEIYAIRVSSIGNDFLLVNLRDCSLVSATLQP